MLARCFLSFSATSRRTSVSTWMLSRKRSIHRRTYHSAAVGPSCSRSALLRCRRAFNCLKTYVLGFSACVSSARFDLSSSRSARNLVSFVQRRGRARQKDSKYVVFLGTDELKADPSKWQYLEAKMKQAYMEDELRALPGSEPEESDGDDIDSQVYRIDSTGAVLTLANAKAHLYHFCAVSTLHASREIDLRPTFDTKNNGGHTPYTAHVQLPSFVHPNVRTASSSRAWHSEPAAIKDAAFQAYVALHKAGLVNDNLLPLVNDYRSDDGQMHRDQPSLVEVSERLSFWRELFNHNTYDCTEWHAGNLTVSLNGKSIVSSLIWLPTALPILITFPLYWNENITYTIDIQPLSDVILSDQRETLMSFRRFTRTMLSSVHSSRMPSDQDDFPVLFSPNNDQHLSPEYNPSIGADPAVSLLHKGKVTTEIGLIRVKSQTGRAFFFSEILSPESSEVDSAEPQVVVTTFPKRRDFMHPISGHDTQIAAYTTSQSFPISECTVDKVPAKYALLAAFVPSIMHRIDVAILVQNLQKTKLADIEIGDSSLVTEAISSPASGEPADYNRFEFLGDAVLKFCAVLQVLSQYPHFPEGYLDLKKDRIVNNNNLAKAALQAGLDRFILTKAFTGSKWCPVYVSALFGEESRRTMSSKVLADVVEALIGAAYMDGGLVKAYTCIRTLLPTEKWLSHQDGITHLLEGVESCKVADLRTLERMIGHQFNHPALLVEAITHVSFPNNRTGLSYERLEFLGDAVLDLIIVPKLFAHARKLKHWELHRLRGALVNADFLAFSCMNLSTEEERYDVVQKASSDGTTFDVETSKRTLHLHDFLRAGGQVLQAKRRSLAVFEQFRSAIQEDLLHGCRYPWANLIALQTPKFISDMVESVLGAIYLDNDGNMSACEAFIERLGILEHMRRVLDDKVETAFPKEQVGILADRETVTYDVKKREGQDGKKTFDCTVKIGEIDVATAKGCGSQDEAEARAASEAALILEAKAAADGSTNHRIRKLDVVVAHNDTTHAGMNDVMIN